MISLKVLAQSIRSHNTMPVLVCWGFLRSRLPLIQTCVSGEYSAANYLIPICILFDTDKKRATANYLIPNPPSFDGF